VSAAIEPFGDAAFRARLAEGIDGRALLETLRALPGVVDAVVTERHALVTFEPARPPAGFADAVARAEAAAAEGRARVDAGTTDDDPAAKVHEIRVRYDGPDLDAVAAAAGVSRDEVIAIHQAATYVVAAIGFLPGFAYLRGLDPRLVVPRRASPRPRVPALSVAIAGPYAGVYPFASPGGWHLLGTALGFAPFDPRVGAALALGDRVRFAS
jgi:5-oxoprolinase (ATP-hydrolysing) subunit A